MKLSAKSGFRAAAALVLGLAAGGASAADQVVVIGYQTVVDPAKVAQAEQRYEKASGWTIDWRKFDAGADVIAAMASGAVQIGYVGSSPLAAAASRELPVKTVLVAALLGDSEAFVVRNGSGIEKPEDLIGKTIGVPFVSTTHYSLLAALKHWQIDPKQLKILNLRPPELAAAWQRGDIDGGYVWDPALGKLKETGRVLISSADVARWGAPTFDAWIARSDFIAAHPEVVQSFVSVTLEAFAAYRQTGQAWTAGSPEVRQIARLTGAKPEEIPDLLRSNQFPLAAEQASSDLLGGGTVQAISATAGFLADQGKIPAALPDYRPYVDARFVSAAH